MTEKLFKRLDITFGWVAFLVALIVYMLTLEPTVSFWDCGEFSSTANKLEVGHPPGAPFFMLVARFFAMFASDATQVAYMINTFSAVASAFTIMFLYWTIVYFAKRMIAPDKKYNMGNVIAIIGAGVIGAMAYTFSDTFWFSAVEAEVYAFSSFFTAIVFWAILKWSEIEDPRVAARWLLLIALMTGMAIGVHLLNLLTIPALAFVVYFKKFKPTVWGIIITIMTSILIIAVIMWGLIPGVGIIASKLELLFVNKFGLPFNAGFSFWVILTIVSLVLSIYFTQYGKNNILKIVFPVLSVILIGAPFISGNGFLDFIILAGMVIGIYILVKRKKDVLLNLIMTAFTLVMIGYSSYAIIVIRSNANPPMDQNSPDDVFNFLSYLNREQYGDRPLLYGKYYNAGLPNESSVGSPVYVFRDGEYKIVSYRRNYKYDPRHCTIFPRMFSDEERHIDVYKDFGDIKRNQKPTFANNIKFFFSYQMNWMYWRYFMWNFAGRQNDVQGDGNAMHGNWISGIKSIDNMRLGDQDLMPDYLKENKANNKYYMLPLILGLLGLAYQLFKHKKDWWIVTLLFILTGIAIVVYLNQTPLQPRERDYAYAGSFYAFSVWIGLGVVALYGILRKFSPAIVAGSIATLICIPVPLIMATENWDDHNRSNRYVARDFGHNYLISCAPNAILFTHGDNDTFPVWYAQEVEGIRTDVKVCCLPYFNSDWYIDQMKTKSYEADPMPLTISRDKYEPTVRDYLQLYGRADDRGYISLDSLLNYIVDDKVSTHKERISRNSPELNTYYFYPKNKYYLKTDVNTVINNGTVKEKDIDKIDTLIRVDMDRNSLYKNEMMILDLLRTNNWERPIYYTSIKTPNVMGLDNYFQNEGFNYRLVPINSGSQPRIDTEILYNNMMNLYKWGNMNDPDVYIDHTIDRSTKTIRIRENFRNLAIALVREGDTVKAREVMERAENILPIDLFVPGYFDLNYVDAWYTIGDYEKGDEFLREVARITMQELDFLYSLPVDKMPRNAYQIEFSMLTYQNTLRYAQNNKRSDLLDELIVKFNEYESLFRRYVRS
ncbi:MAG: DUF2723 domain-containing protein [Bacteroidales bacterium]|jgi:hypothetical protein|nr:DUF2723 domain-containing protein [Bacteroidales bacterium]